MTTIELQSNKLSIIEDLLKIEDAEVLIKVRKYIRKICKSTPPSPCCFSVKEMDTILDQAEKDIANGNTINSVEMHSIFQRYHI